ncbi:AAA family ATPase [Bordetella genomosp. 9]|nr:AAA family ATPase [Bordetella genomosp. 9]
MAPKTFRDFGIDVGTKSGVEVKVICPQCSPHRKKKNYPCLNVNTEKGVWHCWHCDWSGSLGNGVESRADFKKTYKRPAYVTNRTDLPQSVVDFFAQRGISQATLQRNRIGVGKEWFPQVEAERSCITFPFLRGGECVNVKYRTPDKLFRMAAGAERVLYGLDDITSVLIWVEGEMDKLSMEEAGYQNCVSVPDGAPAPEAKNYANKFDFMDCPELAAVNQHIIAVDNDPPGRRLQEELIRRLGPSKCLIVDWPEGCKDANDVLVKLGPDELQRRVIDARPVPVDGTSRARDYRGQVWRRYAGEIPKGFSTGWTALDPLYKILPGDWTLVTGIPGSGKSEWLDALAINLARGEGWNFAVYSPENDPVDYHLEKMAEKVIGKPFDQGQTERMSVVEVEEAMDFLDDHFTHLIPEEPTLGALLDRAAELVTHRGIRGLILDPWNEIVHERAGAASETDYISVAISRIRRFSRQHGVHTWVVAHPTKLQKDNSTGKYPVPTPYDVAGSAHWRNKADNCITVHRDQLDRDKPVQIHVQKIRKKFLGRVGMAELRYDQVTGRYQNFDGATLAPVYSFQSGGNNGTD